MTTTKKIHTIADCLKALVRAVNNVIKKDSEAICRSEKRSVESNRLLQGARKKSLKC